MSSGIFYRNVRARDQLDVFFLAAVSSLLVVRLYLHLTGYPQIGSGGLHIAHMLWGGTLMVAAITIALSFLGARAQRVAALVGGIGFGVFIDELGKFITRDNNYFYEPTIGLIYAIFIGLYLCFNFLSRSQPLTSREYQLNALAQLEEAIVHDMNPTEKQRVERLLSQADQKDPLTHKLQDMLTAVQTITAGKSTRPRRLLLWIDRQYFRFWHWRNSNIAVRSFFLLEALIFVGAVVIATYGNVSSVLHMIAHGPVSYPAELLIGQFISSLIAASFALYGAIILRNSRLKAYEQFRRATLVNIYLTQFFTFARIEFAALPGFMFNLALLGLISWAIRQEVRAK